MCNLEGTQDQNHPVPESFHTWAPRKSSKKQSLSVDVFPTTRSVAQCHSTDANFLQHFAPQETLFCSCVFVSKRATHSSECFWTNTSEQNSDSHGEILLRVQRIESGKIFMCFNSLSTHLHESNDVIRVKHALDLCFLRALSALSPFLISVLILWGAWVWNHSPMTSMLLQG